MTATRYKVIETALCIGDSVFDGEEVVVLAAEYGRLEQERDQWHQLCAEAQVQRDQYQDQRDAALKQVKELKLAVLQANQNHFNEVGLLRAMARLQQSGVNS